MPGIAGRYRADDYGPALLDTLRAGRSMVRPDVARDPTLTEAERRAHAALQLGATVNVPLVKAGRLAAILFVHHAAPRAWTADDLALVEAVAERTWDAVERARAEAALVARDARYRALLASLDTGFCVLEVLFDAAGRSVDFRYLETNATFERQSGLAGVVGRRVREFVPDLEARWLAIYGRVALTGEPERVADYSAAFARWFDVFVYRVDDPALRRVAVLFTDVTLAEAAALERDRLLAALGAERERLRAVVLSMPSPLALHVGPEHHFELVNDAFQRISGGGRDDTGKTVREEFPELPGQGIIEALDRVYATGEPWVGAEVPIRYDRHGRGLEDTWYNVRYEPVRDADGAVWGVLNFAVEVTDQVRARQEVERLLAESEAARAAAEAARAEAQAANLAKSEFLAVMSHELRTPLNAIGGYAELVEPGIHGPVTPEQRTALERIQRSQRHLLGLIARVLDYSRVEAGAVTYRLANVPVAEAVAEAEVLVAPQLRAKGLGYAWAGAPPGLAVRADREKLQQVLLNLLGNAVKFTDARGGVPGRVEVACSVAEGADGAGSSRVRIHVRDTGAGIAADELERIFEPFVQADQRLTRPHAGVGLGLAISRDLARGLDGDLTAESTPGVGSTFTLTPPAA